METISVSYEVSFGKCDGGDGELDIIVSNEDFKWISVVKKLTEEIDSVEIKKAVKKIKKEIERIKNNNPNEEYETQLHLNDGDDEITKEELLSVDWDSIDIDAFVDKVYDEIYEYEEECYEELYGDDFEEDDDSEDDDSSDEDDDYPGSITRVCWN